jgi:hypothetical protein
MGLFNNRKNTVSGNSGNASSGGWTLTGTCFGPGKGPKIGSMRKEWKSPRSGDLAHRASKRPKQ